LYIELFVEEMEGCKFELFVEEIEVLVFVLFVEIEGCNLKCLKEMEVCIFE